MQSFDEIVAQIERERNELFPPLTLRLADAIEWQATRLAELFVSGKSKGKIRQWFEPDADMEGHES